SASASHSATITVAGIADPPTVSTPTPVITSEHTAVTLAGLSVSEATGDSGDTINVTLSVGSGQGSLTLGTTTGLSGLTGNGSGTVMFSGLAAAVNTALGNVSYNSGEFEGNATVTLAATSTEESGGTASASASHSATITVAGIADPPTVSTPTPVITSEHTAVTLAGLSVSEATGDSGDTINVTLSVGSGQGSLTLGTTTGLSGLTGNGSGTVVFSGLAAAVNTALGNVSYNSGEFEGNATVTLAATSTEESGGTASASASHSATITVAGIADPPTVSTPTPVITSEHTAVTLAGLSVSEATGDSGDTINVTLSVGSGQGSLTLGTTTGLSGLTGNGSGTVMFSGLAAAVNTALGNVSYNSGEFEGNATVTLAATSTEESGGTASASASHSATITVAGIADPPTVSTPTPVITSEHTAVTLAGLSVSEATGDSGDTINVTLSVGSGQGSLTLGTTTGLRGVTGNGR